MAANTVFIIFDTAGVPIAAIQPNTLNGPGGVQQSSDLSMFGLGYALWGQASDQNDYRLLENFACPQSVLNPTPIQPMGTAELGNGNGVNVPIVGQLWFNTTASQMYVCTSTNPNIWQSVAAHVIVPSGPTNPSPVPVVVGTLFFNTTSNQLLTSNGLAWVAGNFLPLSGGTMTGDINMGNHNILAANNVTTTAVNASYYRAPNGITSNQITIPVDGATTFTDGPSIGPYVIIHTGNASFLNNFVTGMIIGWRSPTPPAGWAICDGTLGTPDLRNRFIVGAGLTYASGGTYGSLTPTLTINSTPAGVTGSHVLALSETPAHHHAILYSQGSHASGSGTHWADLFGLGYQNTMQAGPSVGTQIIQNTGGGLGHTHTIPAQTYSGTVNNNIPPSVGLFWIMKL